MSPVTWANSPVAISRLETGASWRFAIVRLFRKPILNLCNSRHCLVAVPALLYLPTKTEGKMSQEIFYWLTALFIVASVWGAGRLVDYFLQKDGGELVISKEAPPPDVTGSEVQ